MRIAVPTAAVWVAALLAAPAQAVVVHQWNFNSATPDGNAATGTKLPSIGGGAATVIGDLSLNYDSGSNSDSAAADNSAARLYAFPISSAGDMTAGMEFSVSTVGYVDPVLTFDLYQNNRSSRYGAIQYALDGVNFVTFSFFDNTSPNSFISRVADFSAIVGADNNANLKLRVVSAFQSTATGSGASNYVTTSSSYSSGGSSGANGVWRFDIVSLSAVAAVPEASSFICLGAVGMLSAAGCGLRKQRLRAS